MQIPLNLPEYMQRVRSMPEDPKDSIPFMCRTERADIFAMVIPIDANHAMPFNSPQKVIDGIHSAIGDDQGLIEVKNGVTDGGNTYIYSIVKSRMNPSGVQYTLTFHISFRGAVVAISAFFTEIGVTGERDAQIFELVRKTGVVKQSNNGKMEGWTKDPYDQNFAKGNLFNLSEDEQYDKAFPWHALSIARDFVDAIVVGN